MAFKNGKWLELNIMIILVLLSSTYFTPYLCLGETRSDDVMAVRDMLAHFSDPGQLNWTLVDGDPCLDAWTCITCEQSTIVSIKLPGLGLLGKLGFKLHILSNLRYLDLSSNKIYGPIPIGLPHNLEYMNLAGNNMTEHLPGSFHLLVHLRYLDLSFNRFTGDLPISFSDLANLNVLALQSNQFTGPVTVLANLPLTNLNIKDNQFNGSIPKEFEKIPNLSMSGNNFEAGETYPPPSPIISPTIIERPSPHQPATKKKPTTFLIVIIIGGCVVVAIVMFALLLPRQTSRPWRRLKKNVELTSLPI